MISRGDRGLDVGGGGGGLGAAAVLQAHALDGILHGPRRCGGVEVEALWCDD